MIKTGNTYINDMQINQHIPNSVYKSTSIFQCQHNQ